MNETNTTIVSEPVTPIQAQELTPVVKAKPAKRKPAKPEPEPETQAVAVFNRDTLPLATCAYADDLVSYRKGDDVTKADGSIVKATRDYFGAPTLKAFRAKHGDLDESQAIRAWEQLSRDAKPLAMARMSAAASSAAFVLRQHTQSRAKKSGLITLGLVLKEVKLVDELHNLMTSSGKSEAECRAFLNMPEIGS